MFFTRGMGLLTMPDSFYDDDLDLEDPENQETKDPIKELRAQARRLAKELKEAKAANEDLAKFKTEYESNEKAKVAAKIFTDLGLPEAQAKAFIRLNPDAEATADAVKVYAREYGLVTADAEVEEEVVETTFRPISTGGTSTVKGTMKHEEYEDLMRTNPQAALQAVAENRVQGLMSTPRE